MRPLVLSVLLLTTPAMARPPPGVDVKSAEHAWWECHHQPVTKKICCWASDGHALGDNKWRAVEKADGTQVYQVHVGLRWYDVPPGAVVNDTHNCGPEPDAEKRAMAKVWYAPIWEADSIIDIKIYCFMIGTMY